MSQLPELAPGWEKVDNPDGDPYYYDEFYYDPADGDPYYDDDFYYDFLNNLKR